MTKLQKLFTLLLTTLLLTLIIPAKTLAHNTPNSTVPTFSEVATELNEATGSKLPLGQEFLSTLISTLLPITLILAGMLLFLMLIAGGFTMLSNPTNPQAQETGKARITWAFVGFFVLFLSYWIIQILQIVFGISIV